MTLSSVRFSTAAEVHQMERAAALALEFAALPLAIQCRRRVMLGLDPGILLKNKTERKKYDYYRKQIFKLN